MQRRMRCVFPMGICYLDTRIVRTRRSVIVISAKMASIHETHKICTHGFMIEIGLFLLKGKNEMLEQTS